jgi:Arc/MetJ-type ribon-helix-helix transcriptional regulator
VPEPTGEPADVKRELTLTRSTDQTLDELVALYQRATGSRVHASHVMRALLRALSLALPEIERSATALGPLRRPSNAPGREAERDEFEARLAESLLAGLRARGHAG